MYAKFVINHQGFPFFPSHKHTHTLAWMFIVSVSEENNSLMLNSVAKLRESWRTLMDCYSYCCDIGFMSITSDAFSLSIAAVAAADV